MKVYGHPLSTCTRKVLMTLAETRQRADFSVVDLFSGEQKTPAHLNRHPFGVIPVLDDDGFVLWESRAIIRYLDARTAAPVLTPRAPRELARMDQWLSVDQSYVAPHTRALASERIVKAHLGQAPDPAIERAAEVALMTAFEVIDRTLASAPYLTGEVFSLADISLMPYVASLPMLNAQHLLAERRHLTAWWTRVSARSAWQQAIDSAG
jgi:glutathione S-transferase